MSLEAALDEERLDILALLEGRPLPSRINAANKARTASPAGASATKSPVRSMLDVGDDPMPLSSIRNASIAGIGGGITSPNSNYRSLLDLGMSDGRNRSANRTTAASPPPLGHRSASPAISHSQPKINLEKEYNFEILPTNEHGSLPKRVSQGGKKLSGGIFGSYDTGRSEATRQLLGKQQKSHSPAGIFGRSKSPPVSRAARLNTNSSGLMVGPNTFVTDSGQLVDMSNAYRRLSDAALVRSGGSLAGLPTNKNNNRSRGEFLTADGGVRLTEDYSEDEAINSSDSSTQSSGEEDGWGTAKRRGRGRRRTGEDSGEEDLEDDQPRGRQPKSLLAAAEDERKFMANSKIVSLLDPKVPGVDKVDGKPMNARKSGIHPRTSYDIGSPHPMTPFGSDDEEEMDDIKRAQRLEMNVSPVSSDPQRHRCIRQILRGDYKAMATEAAQGLRRQRMYLVATDLSEEAAYALEWTVGTVLKDGDTLFAIYAAESGDTGDSPDKEHAKQGLQDSAEMSAVDIGEGANMMNDTAEMVRMLSNTHDAVILPADQAYSHNKTGSTASFEPSSLRPSSQRPRSASRAPPNIQKLRRNDFSGMSRSEKDRWKSTEAITERCIALLRKTKLQVRVVIDVFHCKSPRHMITEVIDYLDPTLVILGSRGRSAIKGVLLGSFSNYLVTKSSVPVMVARKKLRKQSKSLRRPTLRFSNVLQTPGAATKLEDAKIDKLITRDT